jgi:hypothetical protein
VIKMKQITRAASLLLLALALPVLLAAAGKPIAGAYPGPESGRDGWTAERAVSLGNPRQAQVAHGGGYLYMVADNGSDVSFYRAPDELSLDWSLVRCMDVDKSRQAADAYIAASGNYVAVSFKEVIGGRWALVVRCSWDNGATWPYQYVDAGTAWSNYEAHLDIAGSRVHAAYVTDYHGRSEVYYLRFDMSMNLQRQACATDSSSTSATYPCIDASGADSASIYYTDGDGAHRPISQAYTNDGGSTWSRNANLIPTGGGTDMTWPEVTEFYVGGERRTALVCDGRNGLNAHTVYYRRYAPSMGGWGPEKDIHLNNVGDFAYPQISSKGSHLLVTVRGSATGDPAGGVGKYNASSGENDAWSDIDGLFYAMMPCDHPASTDCCSDGTRFFAVAAGTGAHAGRILTKREDVSDPTACINDPGKYHRAGFHVTASCTDDFNHTETWMLGPSPFNQGYEAGIVSASFEYRLNGGTWKPLYNDPQAPWDAWFDVAGKADGTYDLKVAATDTAGRKSENILTGVVLDRKPPQVELDISGPDGENGWYADQPGLGPIVAGTDEGSGIKQAYYRFDDAAAWIVYSEPFALPEGEHAIHYYAEDKAGNISPVKTFTFKADFTDPRGAIVSPGPGNYYQKRIEAEASCEDAGSGVSGVTWLVDGGPMAAGSDAGVSLDISGLKDGQHTLEAEVKDAAGRRCRTSPVLFYKDVTPPSVEVVEPTGENWVRGMVTIKADIRDNLKVGRAVFYVDGVKVDERTSAPWMASWDTSTAKNGYHAIRVKAWDAAGNQAEVSACGEVTVYVGNNISETNHFAEGCTRTGFDTWLCMQNPGEETASVTVNYYLGEGQGAAAARTYSLPPHSRTTVYVNGDVGADKDVSIQVTSSRPIVSERPMYFDYAGTAAHHWKGGHTAQGAHFPREDWYFAEGCTREGFETWLCLQNPQGREAMVRVEYMMENGASLQRTYRVAPWSRGTVLVNGEVGPDHDVSMRVASDVPIVAERPVYFLYQGMWDGGHNVMGAAQPEREWYFAEGCTRTGFNQWICLQNPNAEATVAKILYVMEDGGRIEREYALAPRSRFTVNVNNDVARQHDVSARVTSGLPIVVERPMYFLYNSIIDEGSNAMGVCKPGSSWYLAEGCTRAGFEQWICLMNPGEEKAEVALRFMLEDASQREHVVSVPPGTRVTVKVNDVVGPEHDVSCEVMSDRPVIVERPMYSMYRGSCPSGDTLSGYTFNP